MTESFLEELMFNEAGDEAVFAVTSPRDVRDAREALRAIGGSDIGELVLSEAVTNTLRNFGCVVLAHVDHDLQRTILEIISEANERDVWRVRGRVSRAKAKKVHGSAMVPNPRRESGRGLGIIVSFSEQVNVGAYRNPQTGQAVSLRVRAIIPHEAAPVGPPGGEFGLATLDDVA